ncbi:hypothetical protein FOCC_FOCC016073 [Frankliniella occidentalis]|nr:hypothetical protein FOCC_FOCC016073 [Frankliniella occidentalis]
MSSKRSLSSDDDDDVCSSPFKLSQGSEISTFQSENDTMPCSSIYSSVPDSESAFDTASDSEVQTSFCRQLSYLNEDAQSSFCQEPSSKLPLLKAKDPSSDGSSISQIVELTTSMDYSTNLVGAGLNSVVDMEGSFDLINSQDSAQLLDKNDVESHSSCSDVESDLSCDVSDYGESGTSNYSDSSSDEGEVGEVTDQEDDLDSEQLKNVIDPPLYRKCPIRLSESCIAILGFIFRHQPNKQEVIDLLGLISLHCRKEESHMKTSLDFFNKFFSDLKAPLKYHYFCSACLEKLPSEKSTCPNKGKKGHPDSPGISFFLEMDLIPQLQSLFSKRSFYNNLKYPYTRKKVENSNIEDIYDAQLYQEQIENGFLGPSLPHNFSMTWNSDGIPVFKSKNSSLWPVYFMINELPYKLRIKKENMLLGGLWFGSNPIANKILEPLLTTLKAVYRGFPINPPDSSSTSVARGILLSGALDIPAKAKFMGMKQSGACEYGLRNHSETEKLGEQSLKLRKPETDIHGVKYPSFLFKLMPDVIRGMVIDDLHTIYLGVEKKMLTLWFDSKHSSEDFSIRKFLPLVDRRLSQIKLPNFVQRNVSAIGGNEVVHWKGNQYFIFMMILSLVVLEDILPDKYLESYADLVVAVNKLTSASIVRSDLAACDKMIIRFIKEFQKLYGEKYMSIVIHLLQHLVFIVTNLGPIGAVSCFPFESMNGKLLKMVHGTRYVHSQVANCAFLFMRFHEKVNPLPPGDVKQYCESKLHPTSLRLAFQERISNDLFSEASVEPYYIGKKIIPHIQRFQLVDTFTVIPLENILKMLYYVNFDGKSYVCENNTYTVPD